MGTADTRTQWEGAAPGWARWEATIADWMEPTTDAMLAMAGVEAGARVLDLACGAGSQTLRAAQRAGARGQVVAAGRTPAPPASPTSPRWPAPPRTWRSLPGASTRPSVVLA